MNQQKAVWILLVLLGFQEVELQPPTVVSTMTCGEEFTMIVCQANSTNRVTISVSNDSYFYGSHTYERSSKHTAKVGPLQLNLTAALVDTNNIFLTHFTVVGTGKHKETINITCADVYSSSSMYVKTESKHCYMKPIQWTPSVNETTVMLQWDAPMCEGWEEIFYYEVIGYIFSEGSTYTFEVITSFESVLISADVANATVNAKNICGETTVIATGHNAVPNSNSDNNDEYARIIEEAIIGVGVTGLAVALGIIFTLVMLHICKTGIDGVTGQMLEKTTVP